MTPTATTARDVAIPPLPKWPLPATEEVEPIDRAETFVRLPLVHTVVATVVVAGRLKPLPLPDLDD